MIPDSSVLVAILLREPEHETLTGKIADAKFVAIGSPNLLEAGLVISSRISRQATPLLAAFLVEFQISVIPFSENHWSEALRAFWRFGKGRHTAALNFGDCMAYATARIDQEPLLFVGGDFSETDIPVA